MMPMTKNPSRSLPVSGVSVSGKTNPATAVNPASRMRPVTVAMMMRGQPGEHRKTDVSGSSSRPNTRAINNHGPFSP